jgi:hypothetical protein
MDRLCRIGNYRVVDDDEFNHQISLDQPSGSFNVFNLWIFDRCDPVGVLNSIIVCIDIYYLYTIYSKKEVFEILEINSGSEYLKRFLSFHDARIQKILPGFSYHPDKNSVSFFILRNMSVAGLFLAHRDNDTVLTVNLDYVLPEYKDFKNGKYVYFKVSEKFREAGFTSVVAEGNNQSYFNYLKKLGFREVQKGKYTREL